MKKFILPAFALSLILSSCGDNIDKVADGMCDCYSKSDVKFSSPTKKILVKLSESKNPLKTYTAELEKMEPEDQQKVTTDMQEASRVSDDEDMKTCVEKVDAKYKIRGTDETSALKKVMTQMKDKGGSCQSWAGLLNLGLQAKEKGNADDAEETTPKKKKNTDDE